MTVAQDPSRGHRGHVVVSDRACVHCRYNLRGISPEGVCPECGSPVRDSLGDLRILALGDPTLDLFERAMLRLTRASVLDAALALLTVAIVVSTGLADNRVGLASARLLNIGLAREAAQACVYGLAAAGLAALARCPPALGGPGGRGAAVAMRVIAFGQVALSACSLCALLTTSRHPVNGTLPSIEWLPADLADTCWLAGLCVALRAAGMCRALRDGSRSHAVGRVLLAAGCLLTFLGTVVFFALGAEAFRPTYAARDFAVAHLWLWIGGYSWGLACAWIAGRTIVMVRRARSHPAVVGSLHPNAPAAG